MNGIGDMKTKQKLELMLNEQVTAAYQHWLALQVDRLAEPPDKARPSVLPHFLIQPRKNDPPEQSRPSGQP